MPRVSKETTSKLKVNYRDEEFFKIFGKAQELIGKENEKEKNNQEKFIMGKYPNNSKKSYKAGLIGQMSSNAIKSVIILSFYHFTFYI